MMSFASIGEQHLGEPRRSDEERGIGSLCDPSLLVSPSAGWRTTWKLSRQCLPEIVTGLAAVRKNAPV
jgi:hypothetical protein